MPGILIGGANEGGANKMQVRVTGELETMLTHSAAQRGRESYPS